MGYANLAIGLWALVAAAFNWGLACGVVLGIYATYLLCALFLHISKARAGKDLPIPANQSPAIRSAIPTGFFVLILTMFAFIAFARAGVLPFVQV